jgi:hypothetical protein
MNILTKRHSKFFSFFSMPSPKHIAHEAPLLDRPYFRSTSFRSAPRRFLSQFPICP